MGDEFESEAFIGVVVMVENGFYYKKLQKYRNSKTGDGSQGAVDQPASHFTGRAYKAVFSN